MSEQNKAAYRKFIEEAANKGNLDVIDEVFGAEFDPHMGPDFRGPEGERQLLGGFRSAFPDLRFDVHDMFAEGDKVVTRWTVSGTHKADFMGIAPTDNKIEVAGITIIRFAGGKIAEEWASMDTMGMMQQLGVVPS